MTQTKHAVLRRCVGCGEMKEKKDLIRILKAEDGSVSIDQTGRKNGRGAYLCADPACLQKAVKNRGLERSLKMHIGEDLLRELTCRVGTASGKERG